MEKIQSAIAKARAARDAKTPTIEPRGAAAAEPATLVQAAWDALETFRPDDDLLQKQRIVTVGAAQDGTAYFDILRTKVLQQMRANAWHSLAVTSPTPACGKSTTALNLAFSLARQSDLRIILCEMDLHRPTLAQTLGLKGRQDFIKTLRGESDFADEAVRIRSNLAVGVNRQTVRNASELLQGASVAEALSGMVVRFDPSIIIFDMPPMLVSDDVMAFVGQADCALLVATAGTTTISQIDTCERELSGQTNVLGVVMNKVRYMESDTGYDAYN
jgi:Mrp family chromosome partitioning ATPase